MHLIQFYYKEKLSYVECTAHIYRNSTQLPLMMKVNMDVTGLQGEKPTGVGVYIQNLVNSLKKLPELELMASCKMSNFKKQHLIQSKIGVQMGIPYIPFIYDIIPHGFDLFHGPDYWIPPTKSIKKVVTIHDFSVFHSGLWGNEFASSGIKKLSNILNRNRPDHVIVVSDFIKNELIERFPQYSDRVSTVYHGADHFSKGISLPRQYNFSYIVCVGTIEVRKNVLNLAKAFSRLNTQYPELKLIFAGGSSGFNGNAIAAELKSIKNVVHLDYVSKENLQNLIENAEFMVYPSLYEGFGFPILEAMSLGTAVLTSNFGAMKEIAGGHAFLSNTLDIDALTSDLTTFLENHQLRDKLKANAMNYVANFTWEKTAKQTLDVYNKVIKQ